MGKFLNANTETVDILTKELNFTYHTRNNDFNVKYYTNYNTGKQIRIDFKHSSISLLSNTGNLIKKDTCFTVDEIKKFTNN